MATMNVSLPDEMKAWVEARAKAEGYATSSEYVRAMIRQRKNAVEKLAALIQEGIDSGDYGEADEAYFDGLRARIAARTAAE